MRTAADRGSWREVARWMCGCAPNAAKATLVLMLSARELATLRSRFPILRHKTYLYNCSQGALSDGVEEGMVAYAASWRNSSAPWDEWMAAYESLRTGFARFINASADESDDFSN